LWLTSRLSENKPYVFSTWQSATTHPQRRDNILDSENCLSDGSAEGFRFLSPATTRTDTSQILRVRFVEDELSLPSTKDCNPEQLEGPNTNIRVQRLNILWCKMFGAKSNIASTCAGQQTEHTLQLAQGMKGASSAVLYKAVRLIFAWITLSCIYQYICVIAHVTCNDLVLWIAIASDPPDNPPERLKDLRQAPRRSLCTTACCFLHRGGTTSATTGRMRYRPQT